LPMKSIGCRYSYTGTQGVTIYMVICIGAVSSAKRLVNGHGHAAQCSFVIT